MTLRLAFMGSPDFALPTLQALSDAGHQIACVYTQPPRPGGRGKQERLTSVHAFAQARGYEVRTPKSLRKAEAQTEFAALKLDLAVIVAYGLILPKPILDAPKHGCLNLHASLLPRWRGAAPIQRALMAGDQVTGVQVMQMDEGLDTGGVLASVETTIEMDDTAETLHDRLAALGAPLMAQTILKLEQGKVRAQRQPEAGVTYAHKITPGEARIDWTRSARALDFHIRGLSPQPGAWFELPGERGAVRVKVLNTRLGQGGGEPGEVLDDALLIACGEGALRLVRVQREGRAPLAGVEFLRGTPIPCGFRLG